MKTNLPWTPLLNTSDDYHAGVEYGLVFACLTYPKNILVENCFLWENQDQILLLASRMKWRVVKMERHDDERFFIRLEREEQHGYPR